MTAVLSPSTGSRAHGGYASECVARHDLERRLQIVLAQTEAARQGLRATLGAARSAEEVLRRQRQECEQAAELVVELAELAQSLERSLNLCARNTDGGYAGMR